MTSILSALVAYRHYREKLRRQVRAAREMARVCEEKIRQVTI